MYQDLFEYMSNEHEVTMLEQDMNEVINIVHEMPNVKELVRALNSLKMSIAAHPDYVNSDHGEFRDMVNKADEALEKFKA